MGLVRGARRDFRGGQVKQRTRGLKLGRHVGKRELRALEIGDGAIELGGGPWYSRSLPSRHRSAPPNEQAPILIRPPSSPLIAILKSWPSAPTRFSAGTRTSSRISCAVGCECQPSLRLRAEADAGHVLFDDQARDALRAVFAGSNHGHVDFVLTAAGYELLRSGDDIIPCCP